jgi:uncharacterized protein YbjT (DUF2867 family)
MARVLVIGASRGIGLETVKALLAAGHDVRALARHASKIAIEDARLDKRDADARDKAAVTSALRGVDAVVQTLGVDFGPEAVLRGTTLFSTATRVLVDAMRATGVKRLLSVTGFGTGDSRGRGGLLYDAFLFPIVLKRVYDDKDVQERMITGSGLDWTIVRPGVLTGGAAQRRYRVLAAPAAWRAGFITRADVADFLAREVAEAAYVGKTPVLIG